MMLLFSSSWILLLGLSKHGVALSSNYGTPTLRVRASSTRTLPSPVRGVNLGNLFVFEPWMALKSWASMGCAGQASEFDCVQHLGQKKANAAFKDHWNTWITQDDIKNITGLGLNTVRIPIGFWLDESLVSDKEYFPQGGLTYLEQVCGWASDADLMIILDLHGAPGGQIADNSETGYYLDSPGFYDNTDYTRATQFLTWLTNLIYTNNSFRNVAVISVVNEPTHNLLLGSSMINSYYPAAYAAIRAAEANHSITQSDALFVQFMNEAWGSGDPNANLSNTYRVAYDDHRYILYDDSVAVTQKAYINDSCSNSLHVNGVTETPTIVGEFSLAVPENVSDTSNWNATSNPDWYKKWFAAQVHGYEKHAAGWCFWSWKTELSDYRWDFQDAVTAGVIPTNVAKVDNVCSDATSLTLGKLWLGLWGVGWMAFWAL